MKDVMRLVNEFGGQMCGGSVVVYEDGQNKQAAVCVEGTWVVSEEFRARLSPAPVEAPTAEKTAAAPSKGKGKLDLE